MGRRMIYLQYTSIFLRCNGASYFNSERQDNCRNSIPDAEPTAGSLEKRNRKEET